MLSRTTANGRLPSSIAPNSSTDRPQPRQGAQPQSIAQQPTLKQGETSGRPAPNPPTTTATGAKPPSRSSTTSTTSTIVQHSSFMAKEHVAKLSGEGENRARQAVMIEDALNKYKRSIDAEAKAKAAYIAHGKRVENDPYMTGRDWHGAELDAAELANAWEKAANSARLLHEAVKPATE
ncbi:hypothetical protein B0I37DRAFT_392044 [Chaetomium sp. MPI-CAGE-AT-0009]|nr:hypothetical protein B0I37DRAFT_392044 [Chaetomium sp. MPI-CAGE-AT-0009]